MAIDYPQRDSGGDGFGRRLHDSTTWAAATAPGRGPAGWWILLVRKTTARVLAQNARPFWLIGLAMTTWFASGCASPNVNPAVAQPNTGFVDFIAASDDDLCWDVQQLVGEAKQMKTLFSDVYPLEDDFLRLALPPGTYRLRITFLNRAVLEPAITQVQVENGQVTPVRVELNQAGVAAVETRETSVGGTAYGRYGRRTRLGTSANAMYRLTASPQPSQPYRPKQQMPYAPAKS